MSARVVVRKATPEGWAVQLVDGHGGRTPVGVYPTQAEAVRRGITAARFAAAGIPVEAAS